MNKYLNCAKTGKCCYGVISLTREEFARLYKDLILGFRTDIDIKPFNNSFKYNLNGQTFYLTFTLAFSADQNLKCNFLKEGLCSIYEDRPLICKTYPTNQRKKEIFVFEKECSNCGGINCITETKTENSVVLIENGKFPKEAQKLLKKISKERTIQYNTVFKELWNRFKKEIPEKEVDMFVFEAVQKQMQGYESFSDILVHKVFFEPVINYMTERFDINLQDFIEHQLRLRKEAIEKKANFSPLYLHTLNLFIPWQNNYFMIILYEKSGGMRDAVRY